MKAIRLMLALDCMLLAIGGTGGVHAATYCISQGGGGFYDDPNVTLDHANANVTGSIAWYFMKFGQNNTYVLTTRDDLKSYTLGSTLHLPPSSTLTAGRWVAHPWPAAPTCAVDASIPVQLKAGPTLDDKVMVQLDNYSVIDHIDIHGNSTALHILEGDQVLYPVISNCIIHNTKNNYTSEIIVAKTPQRNPHLVVLDRCQGAKVENNLMRRAGCAPKENASRWIGIAAAIYAYGNKDLRVFGNDIALTLTAGVDFTGTVGAVISDNIIHDTGMNATYAICTDASCTGADGNTHDYIADGVTAYHNLHGDAPQNIAVTWNEIYNYNNHGIHISGNDIDIEHNNVHDGAFSAIRVSDQRQPPDCSSYFSIRYNTVKAGWNTAHEVQPIYVANYKRNAVFDVTGNSFLDAWRTHIEPFDPACGM
jgi:hypothetical protein